MFLMITAETLKELHLKAEPESRYDLPKEPEDGARAETSAASVNFLKAVSLVDYLATAKFQRFIPDEIQIDASVDTYGFVPGYSHAVMVRTDIPVPTSKKLTASTGIRGVKDESDFMLWLALELRRAYAEFGASGCSKPLIFRTNGHDHTVPFIGVIVKFVLKPKDGQTIADLRNDWGVVAPKSDFTDEQFIDKDTVLLNIPEPKKEE